MLSACLEKMMQQRPVSRFQSVILLLILALPAATARGDGMESSTRLSAGELDRLIKSGRAPVIIDVRSAYEYRHGHIPGAVHMPFWQAFFLAGDLAAPRDQPVIVYCQHGPRAGIARFALQRTGYTDVRYLDGHMSGWEQAGLPLETAPPD
jgi:rhodanese-related sulfurtransferase